jgi:hypothetical protein
VAATYAKTWPNIAAKKRPHGSQQRYEHDVPRTIRFRSGACGVCQGSQGQVARRASDPSSCSRSSGSQAFLALRTRDGDSRARCSRPAWRVFRSRKKALDVPQAAYSRPCSSNASGLHGRNSARIGKSARAIKGIICDDVSEFESDMPRHAVRCLCAMSGCGIMRNSGPAANAARSYTWARR